MKNDPVVSRNEKFVEFILPNEREARRRAGRTKTRRLSIDFSALLRSQNSRKTDRGDDRIDQMNREKQTKKKKKLDKETDEEKKKRRKSGKMLEIINTKRERLGERREERKNRGRRIKWEK